MPFFEQLIPPKQREPIFSDEEIIEEAFQYYRATGFPYPCLPKHVCMQQINDLARTDEEALYQTKAAYRVADTYHPHRYDTSAIGRESPSNRYKYDAALRRACRLHLQYAGEITTGMFTELRLVGGQCCSNFRPGFALLMYRKFAPWGGTVLDTSTGYGGRLVGFIASDCSTYIGYDPNTVTHAGNVRLAADLTKKNVILHNLPIEDADPNEHAGQCDFAFTSPPYFCKEIYSDEDTQSCNRYKTARDWCNGFLVPMMRHTFICLKSGCRSGVNIADVTIKDVRYPLAKWAVKAAEKVGFVLENRMEFKLTRRFGAKKGGTQGSEGIAYEPVFIFRKPE
jgi:hypothetical protein